VTWCCFGAIGLLLCVGYFIADYYLGWNDKRLQRTLRDIENVSADFTADGLVVGMFEVSTDQLQRVADLAGKRADSIYLTGRTFSSHAGRIFSDRDFGEIARFSNIKRLNLSETGQSSCGLMELAALAKLDVLVLDGKDFSDSGLKGVGHLSALRRLSLSETSITDAGLLHLQGLRSLREFHARRTPLSGEGFRHLTTLVELTLVDCPITDDGIRGIAACAQLRKLDLEDARISGNGVRKLARLVNLQWLSILQTTATKDDFRFLISQLPRLEYIGVPIHLVAPLQEEGVLPLATERTGNEGRGSQ